MLEARLQQRRLKVGIVLHRPARHAWHANLRRVRRAVRAHMCEWMQRDDARYLGPPPHEVLGLDAKDVLALVVEERDPR